MTKGERSYEDPSEDPNQMELFEAIREEDSSLYEYEDCEEEDTDEDTNDE